MTKETQIMPADPVLELYRMLSPDQQKIATFPFTDLDRSVAQFPMMPRKGVQIMALSPEGQKLVARLIDSATTPYGAKQIRTAMDMPRGGYPNYYFAFYGDPKKPNEMEWRLSGHHITLWSATEGFRHQRVGPLLLGEDPSILWHDEAAVMTTLWNRLDEKAKAKAAEPNGVSLSTLPPQTRNDASRLLDERLRVYARTTGDAARSFFTANGGWDKVTLRVTGNPSQPPTGGSKYHWEFSGAGLTFWGDTANGHLHMLLDVKATP